MSESVVTKMFAILVLIVCIDQAFSLRCWMCNSKFNNDCNDPFNSKAFGFPTDCIPTLNQQPQCRKIKHKDNGQWHIIRGCNINDSLQLHEAQVHLCNADGCNAAGTKAPWTIFALIATPVIAMRLTNLF